MTQYNPAEKGARIGNFIIDQVIIIVVTILLYIILYQFFPDINDEESYNLEILYIFCTIIYYFVFELTLQKTPGKFLTKTRVVDYRGNNPSAARLFLRTLVRFVPLEMISFLFSSMALHDYFSKTQVIMEK